jgi:hypothetical protein
MTRRGSVMHCAAAVKLCRWQLALYCTDHPKSEREPTARLWPNSPPEFTRAAWPLQYYPYSLAPSCNRRTVNTACCDPIACECQTAKAQHPDKQRRHVTAIGQRQEAPHPAKINAWPSKQSLVAAGIASCLPLRPREASLAGFEYDALPNAMDAGRG